LASAELKKAWPSYLATALVTLLTGLVGIPFVTEAFPVWGYEPGMGLAWTGDLYLLCLGTGFAYNWVASGYWYIWRDPFVGRLSFLRGLPIFPRDLVSGRMLTMVLCLLVLTPLFFLPTFLVMNSTSRSVEPIAYLWFVLIWAGYGLLSGGLMLYLELGFRGKTAFAMYWLWFLALALVSVVSDFVLGTSLLLGTGNLARAYGPLPAVASLLAGGAAFVLLGSAATRRLRIRELA
jgi:hypothetical protein